MTHPSFPSSEHELRFASAADPAACDDCDVPMSDAAWVKGTSLLTDPIRSVKRGGKEEEKGLP